MAYQFQALLDLVRLVPLVVLVTVVAVVAIQQQLVEPCSLAVAEPVAAACSLAGQHRLVVLPGLQFVRLVLAALA